MTDGSIDETVLIQKDLRVTGLATIPESCFVLISGKNVTTHLLLNCEMSFQAQQDL